MPASTARQPIHKYCGSSKDRQEIGLPGHCDACCTVGHVVAHPDYGCGDVGCEQYHPISEPAELPPLMRLALDGHHIAREQVMKHGRDRYPTIGAQYGKLLDEVGELGEALIEHQPISGNTQEIREELADVGISLYNLADKLGLNLIDEMQKLVEADTRIFRD